MIWRKQKLIRFVSAVILLGILSCADSTVDKSKDKARPYSIFLGEFEKQDQVESYRSQLNPNLWDKLRIEKIYDRNYKLYYGKYLSSFEAGKIAYNFYTNSLIKKYQITRERKQVLDEFANVVFVAKYLDRPSVFNFNLITKQTEVEWSGYGKKVVSLNPSDDHNSVFITTANRYKSKKGLGYIYDVRVLLLNREEALSRELARAGDGVQLYTYWENKDTFKVNLTSVDSVQSRKIIQRIFPVDLKGNPGRIRERSFDLILDGFPTPPKRIPSEISPNNRFRFRDVYSQGESYIYLRDFNDRSEQLTVSTKLKIKDGRWSADGNYLYIITDSANVSSQTQKGEPAGELFVIDAVGKKLVRSFKGFRYNNLLVHGNLLFFDERSEQSARIKVYDSKHDTIIYTISMFGGCGINNLPM